MGYILNLDEDKIFKNKYFLEDDEINKITNFYFINKVSEIVYRKTFGRISDDSFLQDLILEVAREVLPIYLNVNEDLVVNETKNVLKAKYKLNWIED